MCEYIDKQSVTSMPLLDQLVDQRWLCFLTIDMSCHLINGITSLGEWCDWLDPFRSLSTWSFSILLLLPSWLIHVPLTMRLCNSRLPEEHFVCYQTSQRNLAIIKELYRCLQRYLLGWRISRLGFVTPIVGEVSLGPLGNAHHYKPCKHCD